MQDINRPAHLSRKKQSANNDIFSKLIQDIQVNCLLVSWFNTGRAASVKMKASINAIKLVCNVPPKNCNTNCFLSAPKHFSHANLFNFFY